VSAPIIDRRHKDRRKRLNSGIGWARMMVDLMQLKGGCDSCKCPRSTPDSEMSLANPCTAKNGELRPDFYEIQTDA